MDRAVTGKAFVLYLTYGSRTANQTDCLYQIVNGLVGNVDWGESLTIVACEFRGINRRAIIDDINTLEWNKYLIMEQIK